jgi:hypothetical protein
MIYGRVSPFGQRIKNGFQRVQNSSASNQYIHITVAAKPPKKFLGAISAKNQMSVRLDESRKHGFPCDIDIIVIQVDTIRNPSGLPQLIGVDRS